MNPKLISIVVPAYNEEDNIAPFYAQLQKTLRKLQKYEFEIIFINDGSRDNTLKKIHQLQKKDSRVECIEFVRNFGKEIATTAGLHSAQGTAVVMIDADLQHPIELIPEFIAQWEKGAEVVTGVRRTNTNSRFQQFRSRLFYLLLNKVSDTGIVPNSTDFQLLDRVVVDEFNRLTERSRMTRGLISWLGFPATYIYFDARERANGSATYSTFKLIRLAVSSFVSLSLFPLKFAGYLGLVISLLAGVLGLFMFINQFIINDPFELAFTGPAILAVFILFLVGILLSCLGLIALYIGSIHSEVVNRPLYVMRKRR